MAKARAIGGSRENRNTPARPAHAFAVEVEEEEEEDEEGDTGVLFPLPPTRSKRPEGVR